MVRRVHVFVGLLVVGSAIGGVWTTQRYRPTMGKQRDESYLVSTNQRLTPVGRVQRIEPMRPKDMALAPDGQTLAVLCTGRVAFFQASGDPIGDVPLNAGPLGIAWAPDGGTVYASAENGSVARIDRSSGTWKVASRIALKGAREPDPQVTGLAVSRDGSVLYASMGMRNEVGVINLADGALKRRIAVGVCPYAITLSGDGKMLAVANRGGAPARLSDTTEPSADTPVAVETKVDSPRRGTVSLIETSSMEVRNVDVGKQPAGMAFSTDGSRLYVANSDSDSLSVVDTARGNVVETFSVTPKDDPYFGQIPTSVALSADGKTLYAALGGSNAVAVLGVGQKLSLRGYLPTAWFPICVLSSGGRLFVACSKGFGSRAGVAAERTGRDEPDAPVEKPSTQKGLGVHSTAGTVEFVDDVERLNLGALSRAVSMNNRWGREEPARPDRRPVPVPERVGEPSVFKHVVYIIKENHTYDSTLGDMPEGNGDKNLCMFPEQITPNQHKIAREFVLLDNTYTSGTNSADGHQWTSSSVANGYIEQNYSAYARSYPYDGGDPLAYSPKGFWWNTLADSKISLRIYGEFVNRPIIEEASTGSKRASYTDLWNDYKAGTHRFNIRAETDSLTLRPYLHPRYIGFPINVSDQWRADQFLEEFRGWEKDGKMPSFCMLLLPANHTSGTSPGAATPRAAVADNDLATGRIVEAISKSPYWKETLILIIEDDSQLGLDHVDGHRTTAFCVSPYTRRHAVVSEPYNHTSFARTIGLVLGMPAMTRFDRSAIPLTACFTSRPDLTPFTSVPSNVPLDEVSPPAKKLTGEQRRMAEACAKLDWSDLDRADAGIVARAVWGVMKPGQPFPAYAFHADGDDD